MNPNLLNITTTPISIDINIVNGELRNPGAPNPHAPKPMIKVKTGDGGLKVKAEPAKLNVDTYAARSSMGYGHYNFGDFNKKEAQKGKSMAREGTAGIVREGNALAKGSTISQLTSQSIRSGAVSQTTMNFIPNENAVVKVEKGDLDINYDMREVNIDWENIKVVPLEFHRGRVDVHVVQKPSVKIEYTGRPIYVPPSADPAYKGQTLDATV